MLRKWWIALVLVASLAACEDKKMIVGTNEYREAHGIVAGQTNELRVGGVLFRFPPQYLPDPYTSVEIFTARPDNKTFKKQTSKIVKGQADKVTIHLNLETWFDPPPTAHGEYGGLVRIEILSRGYEDDRKIEYYFKVNKWKPSRDRPDLGLREHARMSKSEDSGWGYLTYESLDPKIKPPRGGRFIFLCNGIAGKPPEICHTYYQHPLGPSISYYLSGQLLPRWKEVHAEVIKLVDTLIIE